MKSYTPNEIESKWQERWRSERISETKDSEKGKENRMLLVEFPYPSGDLHMGHWYAFSLPDMQARYLRMKGYNIMYPIGFDAFGLPAENAAIKRGIHPREWTEQNIATMTEQLESMGAMFDWSRAVSTIDPAYYRWTQWIFLKMHEKGLAYRATTKANWCPKDKTVLANEQVVDGCCERCGTAVTQKDIEQWMFKITAYADRLIDDIEGLDWPQTTVLAQRNWIGRSEGAIIRFPAFLTEVFQTNIEVFTTRPDTIFGVTAVVISPELAQKWIDVGWQAGGEVKAYVTKAISKRELDRIEQTAEKTGVPADISAINPANDEKIPVWIADYVLGHYGTGAVMMVPAHDERDFAFARKYELPIKKVIVPERLATTAFDGLPAGIVRLKPTDWRVVADCWEGEGELIHSNMFDGLSSVDARRKIVEHLERKDAAEFKKTYRLHDWILSRQRYWGVPIPMVKCASCGYVPVPEVELPVELPPLDDFLPTDDGRSPLAKAESWLKVKCPKCGKPAERETDTMDTFVDSSWYYIRYTDPKNTGTFADEKKMKAWLPVPMYVGGAEHNTMHLLYSRFFTKVLYDLGCIHFSEPFIGRRNHGIILGPDGQKMSKSRGNIIDPDKEVAQYGADTVRMYLAFMAPYEQGSPWDPRGINGVYRFLKRVWALINTDKDRPALEELSQTLVHCTIKKVGEDLEALRFNTVVSELMKLLNHLERTQIDQAVYRVFLLLLAPLAPHITEELWSQLGHRESIHLQPWPVYDPTLLIEDTIRLPIQVNGKVRDVVVVGREISEDEALIAAKASPQIEKYLAGKPVRKVIYIPGKMLNIVVG